MEVERILLRRLQGTLFFEEIGDVVEESVDALMVRTSTGATEVYERRGQVLVARGGVNHILRVYPGQLAMIFRDHPIAVAEQVLRDAAKPMTTSDIKAKLGDSDIPLDEVDVSWLKIKKHLDTSDEIHKTSEKTPKYRWKGGPSAAGLLTFVDRGQSTGSEVSDQVSLGPNRTGIADGADVLGRLSSSSQRVAENTPAEISAADSPLRDRAVRRNVVGEESADPAEGSPRLPRLVILLHSLGGPREITGPDQIATRLLECATALKQAKDPELAPLLGLGDGAGLGVALIAARPAATRLLSSAKTPLDGELAAAVVTSAISEYSRADERSRKRLSGAGIALLDRLLSPREPATLPYELLVRVVCTTPSLSSGSVAKLLARATGLLADAVRRDTQRASATQQPELKQLARAISVLPFERTGGRSQLVSSLFAITPEFVVDDAWWQRTNLQELSEAAHGTLAAVLDHPVISESVVAPRVAETLGWASSRKTLLTLAAAPAQISHHVTGQDFRRALERIAQNDPIARAWVRALTNTSELEALRDQLSAAQQSVVRLEDELLNASASAVRTRSERDRLAEQVQQTRQESVVLRDAHERQLKLDLLRALANLSLSVLQSPNAAADDSLMETVKYLTAHEGLTLIDAPGDEVSFDPVRHDSMGRHVAVGAAVRVLRPGYSAGSGQNGLVLVKAHVIESRV